MPVCPPGLSGAGGGDRGRAGTPAPGPAGEDSPTGEGSVTTQGVVDDVNN